MDIMTVLKDFNPKYYKDEIKMQCPYRELHSADSQRRSQAFINLEKNLFHCFSCGTKGTATNVLTAKLGLSLKEAIDLVKFKFIEKELPEYGSVAEHSFTLPEHTPEYIIDFSKIPKIFLDRGFPKALLEHFKVGTAVIDGEKVSAIPYYQDKKLVGVKYRVDGDSRYFWYSGGFIKANFFYNEVNTKDVILVEGETDTWKVITNGSSNVEATLGTNLSEYHISKLQNCRTVFLAFDNDSAGFLAKELAYHKLKPYVDNILFVPYPTKDPGDCSRIAWRKALKEASDYAVYSLEMTMLLGNEYEKIQKTAKRFLKIK